MLEFVCVASFVQPFHSGGDMERFIVGPAENRVCGKQPRNRTQYQEQENDSARTGNPRRIGRILEIWFQSTLCRVKAPDQPCQIGRTGRSPSRSVSGPRQESKAYSNALSIAIGSAIPDVVP